MIFDRSSFYTGLSGIGRLMGIDVGTKTLGIAVSDLKRNIASADYTIRRMSLAKDVALIDSYIKDKQISGVVVGWPLNMNGTTGAQCDYVKKFCDALCRSSDAPILLWDERLSSEAVDRMLIQAGARREKRKQIIDSLAASYILQGALDATRQRLT
ncbi:MAG: Holliday junction resolvase RuvX [Holosporales bacterium]|jgi:putative Holliday junction resolvase|nr:Holliday junction resolvase RuvX [Holosporales bacterium]